MSWGPSVLDESRFFSREEFVAAHALVMPRAEAEQFVHETFLSPPTPEKSGRYTYLGDDTLDLLSLVSQSCASRVRDLRNETEEQALKRRQRFMQRTGLHPQWQSSNC